MAAVHFIIYVAEQANVAEQAKSRDFYAKILGKEPILDVPGMTEFELGSDCVLGLMPEKGIAKIIGVNAPNPALGNRIPRCELYLTVENVEESCAHALSAGGKFISAPTERNWGDFVGYIADFDGHIIAFARKSNL